MPNNPKILFALWLVRIVVHGVCWAIGLKMGWEAGEAQTQADMIGQAATSALLIFSAVGSSLAERRHLLHSPPPDHDDLPPAPPAATA